MTHTHHEAAAHLFAELAALAQPSDQDASSLRCVRLGFEDGSIFDVYKAQRRPGPVNLWSVRGFHGVRDDEPAERKALVLGTRDDRAIVTWAGPVANAAGMMNGATVVSAEPNIRSLDDLSRVMAKAVQRLLGAPSRDTAGNANPQDTTRLSTATTLSASSVDSCAGGS